MTTNYTPSLPQSSAWSSKTNWTAVVGFAAMLGTFFGINVPEETKGEIILGIGAIQSVVVWVLRTYFTKTVIKAS